MIEVEKVRMLMLNLILFIYKQMLIYGMELKKKKFEKFNIILVVFVFVLN